jgi:hypothetical protein
MILDLGSWADEMEDMPLPCESIPSLSTAAANLEISKAHLNCPHF